MALIKDGAIAADRWRLAADIADVGDADPVFIPLELWRAERERLGGRAAPLGLRLASDESPELVADDLERFAAIALEFPKFTDGRAYSYARILRERYGYRGELRAVGNVLRDQLLFMYRCGFDAVELASGDPEAWHQAMLEFKLWYQPAADGRPAIAALRHQLAAAE